MMQFYRNADQPLKAWSVVSFDKFTDHREMERYIVFMIKTLVKHGVKVEQTTPALLGPIDPRRPGAVQEAMREAAGKAYRLGNCAPQLIFVILPGRSAA